MRSYASSARRLATISYMNEVRSQFKEAIIKKLEKGLNNAHIEALLLFHAGLQPNVHVFEELVLKGLVSDKGRGGGSGV